MDRAPLRRSAQLPSDARGLRQPRPALLSAIGNRGLNRVRQLARDGPTPQQEAALADVTIGKSVGVGGVNAPADVETIGRLLAAAGYDSPQIAVAIRRFQRTVMGVARMSADGLVRPKGATFTKLKAEAVSVAGGGTPTGTRKAFWGGENDWEGILPEASKKGHISRTGSFTYRDTITTAAALTDAQAKVRDTVKAAREKLDDLVSGHTTSRYLGGYSLGDSKAGPEPTPTGVSTPRAGLPQHVAQIVWDEVSSEASLEGVQTYDDQVFGWGKGFSAAEESLTGVMERLFELDPAVERTLYDAGIALSDRRWSPTFKLMNEDNGQVEDGLDALYVLKTKPRLVSLFYAIGIDPAHRQNVADAQWSYFDRQIPAYVSSWPDDTLKFLAHASTWNPALGWGTKNYSSCGGDLFQAVKLYSRYLADGARHGKLRPNGAWVVSDESYAAAGSRLGHWAAGAGLQAVKKNAAVITVTDAQLNTKAEAPAGDASAQDTPVKKDGATGAVDLAKHVLVVVPGRPGQYYDLGAI